MNPTATETLRSLAMLVVKDGVALGGLQPAQQSLALCLVWGGLPNPSVMTEVQINAALKAQLAGAAACLATDHVELRRWLVDAGWLARDGFGREYRPVALAALTPMMQTLAQALGGVDTARWVAGQRAAHHESRAARRRAWISSGAAVPAA